MSATTELLLEQIQTSELALKRARATGDEAGVLVIQTRLDELRELFKASTSALNEGKVVLKG